MSEKICLAQSIEELKFILSKSESEKLSVVPLNLETQLYCIDNKINFINPINIIDTRTHMEILEKSDELIKSIKFGNIFSHSVREEYKSIIRFHFNACCFLIKLLKNINKENVISKVYISGWSSFYSPLDLRNYFISDLVKDLFKNFKIIEIGNQKKIIYNYPKYSYEPIINNYKKNKIILINNPYYNFKRIVYWAKKNYTDIHLINFKKTNLFEKIFNKIKGLTLINVRKKKEKVKDDFFLDNIDVKFEGIDLSNTLNNIKELSKSYLSDQIRKAKAVETYLKKVKPSLIVINSTKGFSGYLAELGLKYKIKSLSISHGTIARSFNKFDKIFKKAIAENTFTGKASYWAIQSKIAEDSLNTHKLDGKAINTGNLIFAEKENNSEKKNVLVAVTIKNLVSYHFLGIEMYYEFIENLKLFNSIAKNKNLNFIIQIHPSSIHCIPMLKKNFKNIDFSKKKIDKKLEKSFVTISFSSTAIEDSLYCNVPVILFDRWSRYKHCVSEEDNSKTNEAIYYATNEKNLLESINSIKKSNKINFGKYIFEGNSKKNFDNVLKKLLV
ncbi:MAG: hypothetical protein CMG67_00125 [Candidatus Marinimicrobia bacterium]|nr:hypothetical protein [Candidatus Neomarinimicrobiota bacterium]